MLEALAASLVLAGCVLVLAMAFLHREAQRFARLAGELIELRAQIGSDALAWFDQAQPILSQGGVLGLHYHGHWYACPIAGRWGQDDGEPRLRQLQVGDVNLEYRTTLRRMRGERRLLRDGLLRVFDLLLEQSVLSKSEAVAVALAQQAELSLYLQHDVKNLAQWVLLLAHQVEHAPDDPATLLAQLREHAPLAQRKAERLADAMSRRRPAEPRMVELRLIDEARVVAGFHGVPFDVDDGSDAGDIQAPRLPLERVLDGLFARFAAQPDRRPVTLRISRSADTVTARFAQSGPRPVPAIRTFEPLAGGRVDGSGLALHQARLAARTLGGSLAFVHADDTGVLQLTLPAGAPNGV